jgi:hypothetical protein
MHFCQRFCQSLKHFSNSIFGIAFSSFSDALLMSSMLVKRRPFKISLTFENKKKSHWVISDEYVLFLAKKLRTSNDEIQQFWNEFCCQSFHALNFWKNVMTWANWYANFISNFCYCDSAIIHNHFSTFFTLSSIIDVLGRPERSSSSTSSRPSCKELSMAQVIGFWRKL